MNTMENEIPFMPLRFSLCLFLSCAFLASSCKEEKPVTENITPEIVQPESKEGPAITIWTIMDLADPLARVMDELIIQHNLRNPEVNAWLVYLRLEDFNERVQNLVDEEMPPDLYLLPSTALLRFSEQGFLLEVDGLLDEAGVTRSEIYESAWRLLEENGRLWGIPVCVEMLVLYVNDDLGKATVDLSVASEAQWERFVAGQAASCVAPAYHLVDLMNEKNPPPFAWHIETRAGETDLSKKNMSAWALAMARGGSVPVEKTFPLWRAAQSPAMSALLWSRGQRIPVLKDAEQTREFVESLPLRGPWLEDF
ncbi:hypothetical protein HQ520_02885 [bacterium]|nr:hypothetical protein [bacterium]